MRIMYDIIVCSRAEHVQDEVQEDIVETGSVIRKRCALSGGLQPTGKEGRGNWRYYVFHEYGVFIINQEQRDLSPRFPGLDPPERWQGQ